MDSELTRTQSSLALRAEVPSAQSPRSLPPTTPKRMGRGGLGLGLGQGVPALNMPPSLPSPDVSLGRAGDYYEDDENDENQAESGGDGQEQGEGEEQEEEDVQRVDEEEEGGLSWLEEDDDNGELTLGKASRDKNSRNTMDNARLPTFDDSDIENDDEDVGKEEKPDPHPPSPCVLLEVAISDSQTDTIVVTATSDPLPLAISFIDAWGLGGDLLPPLVQIIEETRDELRRGGSAARSSSSSSPPQNAGNSNGSSRGAASPSPLQMDFLPTPSPPPSSASPTSPVVDIDLLDMDDAGRGQDDAEEEVERGVGLLGGELDELFSPPKRLLAGASKSAASSKTSTSNRSAATSSSNTSKKPVTTANNTGSKSATSANITSYKPAAIRPVVPAGAQRSVSPTPASQGAPLNGRVRRQTLPPPPPLPPSPPNEEYDEQNEENDGDVWNDEDNYGGDRGGGNMHEREVDLDEYDELAQALQEQQQHHLSPHLKINMEHIPLGSASGASPLVRSYCSTPLSVFSYPPDKSLGGQDIE